MTVVCPPSTPVKMAPMKISKVSKPLLSKKIVGEMTGKIKSVKKLMDYPKATNPELRGYLNRLLNYFNTVLSWTYMAKTKESSEAFEESWRLSKQLEEVVIRAIVIEEDLTTVWRSIFEREKKRVKETDV